jgi:hypothetical protein
VLGALTVLLHVLVIAWLAGHLGPSVVVHEVPERETVVVQLRPEPPPATPVAPVPPPIPLIKPAPEPQVPPPPLPDVAPAPAPPPDAPVTPDVIALDDSGHAASLGLAGRSAGTAPAAARPEPAPTAAPVVPPPTPSPAAPQGRLYKVDVPAAADFELDLKRVDANGTRWSGEAAMAWRHDGSHYSVKLEAGIGLLVTRVNLLVSTSEGRLGTSGIEPVEATEKRKGRALTATHFNRDQNNITFSAGAPPAPLAPGSQDKASLPFQLAAIGRADINQLSGDIDVVVGEDKGASLFRFRLVGQDELDTKMGKLVTWHLTRPPRPGSYSSQLDIWLAPSLGWYPVQIQNKEGNGALTTQTVTKITVNDSSGK